MTSPETPPDAASAPLRRLLGVKEPGQAAHIIVWDTEQVSIGRSSENDVVVEDTAASRCHAVFSRQRDGSHVEDLGTPNGTRLNGELLESPAVLAVKDVVAIGDVQITYIETRRDPASLGLGVLFASELKGFAAGAAGGDPGATALGLTEIAEPFEVDSVGSFEFEPAPAVVLAEEPAPAAAVEPPGDMGLDDFLPPPAVAAPEAGPPCLSLSVELEGLTPDLQRALEGFRDKVIELPALRIRIKG